MSLTVNSITRTFETGSYSYVFVNTDGHAVIDSYEDANLSHNGDHAFASTYFGTASNELSNSYSSNYNCGLCGRFWLTSETGQRTSEGMLWVQTYNVALAPVLAPGVPEPTTWALMILGFGAAGAAVRSRRHRYKLVERFSNGRVQVEEFIAPSDAVAVERAMSVAETGALEVWRGRTQLA
jgi:hypothetical protein